MECNFFHLLISFCFEFCLKKSSNKVEQAVSSAKFSVSDPTISSPLVCDVACKKKSLENLVPSDPNLIGKEQGSSSTQTVVCSVTSEETERLKLEQSATKAQAAFRGYAVFPENPFNWFILFFF